MSNEPRVGQSEHFNNSPRRLWENPAKFLLRDIMLNESVPPRAIIPRDCLGRVLAARKFHYNSGTGNRRLISRRSSSPPSILPRVLHSAVCTSASVLPLIPRLPISPARPSPSSLSMADILAAPTERSEMNLRYIAKSISFRFSYGSPRKDAYFRSI